MGTTARINTVSTFFILLVECLVRLAAREWKLPTPGVRAPAQDVCIFMFPGRNQNPSPSRPYNAVPCFRGQATAEGTQHPGPSLEGLETSSYLLTPHSPSYTHTHTHTHTHTLQTVLECKPGSQKGGRCRGRLGLEARPVSWVREASPPTDRRRRGLAALGYCQRAVKECS